MLKNLRNYWNLRKKANKGQIEFPLKLRGVDYIQLGNNVKLRKNYRIECIESFSGKSLNPKFTIGERVIINYNFTAFISDEMSIGDDTIIASNVLITTENHGINPESDLPYSQQPLSSKKIKIGRNVWIGQNAVILPGVEIGNHSVIAAGSIVTKSIESMCMAAGNPAIVIKKYDIEQHLWKHV